LQERKSAEMQPPGSILDGCAARLKLVQDSGSLLRVLFSRNLPIGEQLIDSRKSLLHGLLADGKITPAEYAQQRTRILNELQASGASVEDTPGQLHFRRFALLQPVRSRERLTLERTPRFSVEA